MERDSFFMFQRNRRRSEFFLSSSMYYPLCFYLFKEGDSSQKENEKLISIKKGTP
jgi:hypothetical protein